MARNKNRMMVVVFVVVAILVGGYALSASTSTPVDINNFSDITLSWRNDIRTYDLSSSDTITISRLETVSQDTKLYVNILFDSIELDGNSDYVSGRLKSGFKIVEVQEGTKITSYSNPHWYQMVFELENCLAGKHLYTVEFRGYSGEINKQFIGNSFSFYIDNQFDSVPNVPVFDESPDDFQILAGVERTLTWKMSYLNDFSVSLTVDGALVDSASYIGSINSQTYSYVFESGLEGQKDIVLILTPTGGENIPVSSTVYGHVVGGEPEPTYPDIMPFLPAIVGSVVLVGVIVLVRRRR